MKKKYMRLTALVLALVMLLSVTALAEETTVSNDKMTITGYDGATVTFDETVDEKINVTYESTSVVPGQFYLVMVVAKTTDEKTGEVSYLPTKDTILYINQTTGEAGSDGKGKIVFGGTEALYPSAVKDSAILIYGMGVGDAANSLTAAIIDAKYVIGDVNRDGDINVLDAILILQYVVESTDFDDTQKQAGNVDGQGTEPDVLDAIKILQYVVGIVTTL